jgi:hypothetical protein
MMGEGEGKWRGWRPLRGGEGADGEVARRGGAPALVREVAAVVCSGKENWRGRRGLVVWRRRLGRVSGKERKKRKRKINLEIDF